MSIDLSSYLEYNWIESRLGGLDMLDIKKQLKISYYGVNKAISIFRLKN